MAGITNKMKNEPFYYNSLTRIHDDSYADFEYIIDLDVNRTIDAHNSKSFSSRLTRILLSYAKYI